MTEARVPPRPGHEAARTPVVVVFGGPSAEHDVSIVSGTAIAAALRTRGLPRGAVAGGPRRSVVDAASGPRS